MKPKIGVKSLSNMAPNAWFLGLALLLLLAFSVRESAANCKMHDAKWKKKNAGPSVKQPSRTDPTKLMVHWADILENERCVDEYRVFAWKDGQTREQGQKKVLQPSFKSVTFEVDPCVGYNFQVDLMENDLMGKDVEKSAVAKMKSSAVPQLLDQSRTNFVVGYYYDPVKMTHDLGKVSIKFPKNILKNPSCVKQVEIVGREMAKRVPTKRTPKEMMPNAGGAAGSTSGGGVGGHGSNTGGIGGSSSNYNPNRPGYGSSGSSSSSTGGGWVSGYPTTTARPRYNNNRGKRSPGWFSRKKEKKAKTTTPRPGAAREAPPASGAGLVKPPFLKEFIEVTAPIKPCYPYKFTLKIVTPQGSTMVEVKELNLPQLTDIVAYQPPILYNSFDVVAGALKAKSGAGIPASCLADFLYAVDTHILNLKKQVGFHIGREMAGRRHGDSLRNELDRAKSKVLASAAGCICNSTLIQVNTTDLKLYKKHKDVYGVYAYDGMHNERPFYKRLHSQTVLPSGGGRSQGGVGGRFKRFIGQVNNDNNRRPSTTSSSGGSYSSQTTTSSWSSNSNSDSNTYGGWTNPYDEYPPLPSSPSSSSSSSRSNGARSGGGTPVFFDTAPATNEKPYFLYWDKKVKAWTIGPKMDGKKAVFRTNKKSPAKCPADPQTHERWEVSGTLKWSKDKKMSARCRL